MTFWHIFLNSIKLPNKKAMFKLNRVGLDYVIFYILLLLIIVSIPAFIDRLTDTNSFGSDMNILFTFIYFFMFYYLPIAIIVFVVLFIIAYIGKLIANIMNRKLHYSLLWKMSSFTVTIPFLLYTIIAFLFHVSDIYIFFTFIYTIGLLARMIVIYPKRRIRSKS